jgi:hypothetical protein
MPIIEDDIAADVRAALNGPAEQPEATTPAEPVEKPSEGPGRDDHGRFVAKPEKGATFAPQTAEPEAPEPIQPKLSPPASWKAAAKAKFNTLDPEVQAEVLRREEEMNRGLAQQETKSQRANRLDELLGPHRDRLALAGVDEFSYLGALMKADEMLRGPNAQQGLVEIARMYGLQMLQGSQQQQQPNGQPPQSQQYADPRLEQKIALLERQLQDFSSSQEEAALNEIRGEVDQFKADPAHVYFENVRLRMKGLIETGQAQDLDDAYDMACWADPEVRKVLLAEQSAPAARPQTRPTGVQVTGSPRAGSSSLNGAGNPNATIEDDVRAALNEVRGRV